MINNDVKLGIPLNMLDFQKNIIHKLIPEDKIINLDIYRYNYKITNCYVGNYIDIDTIPTFLLDKYQLLGYEVLIKKSIAPKFLIIFL